MRWHLSDRADRNALPIADRHYNRQKPGTPQFVPPGRCMVLLTRETGALWVTSFPFARYVRHAWAGAWMNSCFRNEARDLYLSSDLIREAIACTRWFHAQEKSWRSEPEPALGMVTFVDAGKTRKKRDPGRCYRKAGFKHVGFTKAGLWAFQMLPQDMPDAEAPHPSAFDLSISNRNPVIKMKTLQFSNPVFHTGRNITCRRGTKWASETDATVEGVGRVKLTPMVIRFADVTDDMVKDEHDPSCRTARGLYEEMRRLFPDFHANEIVTLVAFDVPKAA